MKICCNCKKLKELSEFGTYKKAPDGLQYRCKSCLRLYHKHMYNKSPQRK